MINKEDVQEVLGGYEVKEYLRLNPDNEEDEYIDLLIASAREYCENRIGQTIAITDLTLTEENPGKSVHLARPPIVRVNSVTCNGEAVAYHYDAQNIYFDEDIEGTVVINYTVGMTECPQSLKTAMLLLIGHWYTHREAVSISSQYSARSSAVEMGVNAILNQYKRWWF